MTPIINPWVFYISDVCTILKVAGLVLGGCAVIAWACFFCVAAYNKGHYGADDDDYKACASVAQKLAPVAVALCVLAVLAPWDSTIDKMILAQNVTYERVEVVGQTVQDIYEDILDVIGDGHEE